MLPQTASFMERFNHYSVSLSEVPLQLISLMHSSFSSQLLYACSYELMKKCWIQSSKERPTFTEIKNYLEKIIEAKLSNNGYIDITVVSATTGEDLLNTMEIDCPSVNSEKM